ncbi:peptidoglycan DD-metalloendopeptidase family protein [Falsiporphyromonas endometrii]|uniref:Peptidoglycan DD-metalloendopeptidase family protein n=1 Tax=Falsiporphyromonas endometrii TaxID=1387297 RepID=A0ABV9K7D3_9PORP
MIKQLAVALCSSLCFITISTSAARANDFGVSRKKHKTSRVSTKQRQRSKQESTRRTATWNGAQSTPVIRRDSVRNLVADRLDYTSRGKKEKSSRRNSQAEYRSHKDQLLDPAVELYGENSWGDFVRPCSSDLIPESYNIDCSGFVMPIKSRRITSNFGYRARFRRMHYGTDIALNTGDTIVSAFPGRVRVSSYEGGGYGNYIIVRHPNGLETIYGHMSKRIANEGDIVEAGEVLGLGGSTGRSTGPHLHFECRFMGVALNPAHLFDLVAGVPMDDYFHFSKSANMRGGRFAASSNGSVKKFSKRGKSRNRRNVASGRVQTYRIKKGDTLSEIAQRNGTSVSKLKRLNPGIRPNRLRPNKSIRIR